MVYTRPPRRKDRARPFLATSEKFQKLAPRKERAQFLFHSPGFQTTSQEPDPARTSLRAAQSYDQGTRAKKRPRPSMPKMPWEDEK